MNLYSIFYTNVGQFDNAQKVEAQTTCSDTMFRFVLNPCTSPSGSIKLAGCNNGKRSPRTKLPNSASSETGLPYSSLR